MHKFKFFATTCLPQYCVRSLLLNLWSYFNHGTVKNILFVIRQSQNGFMARPSAITQMHSRHLSILALCRGERRHFVAARFCSITANAAKIYC